MACMYAWFKQFTVHRDKAIFCKVRSANWGSKQNQIQLQTVGQYSADEGEKEQMDKFIETQ